ncbi:hypothetical protein F4811DRAFT_545411 [Daldinia bambusicola]|nr:hypothetical protein F4811DRAFT_545411 [Daldinia bambusicola]
MLESDDTNIVGCSVLVHNRALGSYVPFDGSKPSLQKAVALKSKGQTQDRNNYQLIWAKQSMSPGCCI